MASDTPAAATLVDSSAYNVFAKVSLTAGSEGDATVTGFTVTRGGYSNDNDVAGVLIKDSSGVRHGNVLTLSDGSVAISFSSDPIVVPAGTTDYVTIEVNLSTLATSGTMFMGVAAAADVITSSDVSGAFPANGNTMGLTASTGIIGAVTVDVQPVAAAGVSVDLGVTDQNVTKFRFAETSSNEDGLLRAFTIFNNGTMVDGDIQNIDLLDPAGNVLATVSQTTDRYITFDLSASPWTIDKGTIDIFTLRADVVSGSARTTQFIIQHDYDVDVVGSTTGVGILAAAAGVVDTTFPIGDTAAAYNRITAAQGSLTVVKSGSSPSGTFGIGAASIVLAIWDFEARGEDIQLQRVDMDIQDISGGITFADFSGTAQLVTEGGVTIYSVSTSAANPLFDGDAASTDQATLSTYHTIPAGTTEKISLVAQASTTIVNAEQVRGRISDIYYKRMNTGSYATAQSTTFVAGNTLTCSAASLTVVQNQGYGNQSIVAGQNNVKVGSYLFQTGSAEGVNMSSIEVDLSTGTVTAAMISNLKLKKCNDQCTDTETQIGTTVSSPSVTADNSFSVGGSLNIPANTTVQVNVYVNVNTTAAASTVITRINANDASGVGSVSTATITAPTAVQTGQTVAASASGTVAFEMETSGASASAFLVSSASGVDMARIKFYPTIEDMKLTRLELRTLNGGGNIASLNISNSALGIDSTVSLTAGTAVFTWASGSEPVLPAYSSTVLDVKATLTSVGTLTASNLGVIGFGTANFEGNDSGTITQETRTIPGAAATDYFIAGTNAFSGGVGDVIYYTVTAAAGTTTAPGFYMVTTVNNTTLTTAGSLDLNGGATGTSWTALDRVTLLADVETKAGNATAGASQAWSEGDIVYVYNSGASGTQAGGFAVITTGVAGGAAVSGVAFAPSIGGVTSVVSAGTEQITLFTNANALVGNTMRYEEVEPTISVASSSPSGTKSPTSSQTVAVIDVKADGYRDMTFDSFTLEMNGSNRPWQYVRIYNLYNGTNLLAQETTPATAVTGAGAQVITGQTSLCFGSGAAASAAGELQLASAAAVTALGNDLAVGDHVVLFDDTTNYSIYQVDGVTVGTCFTGNTAATDVTLTVSNEAVTGTAPTSTSATMIYVNNVHFDSNSATALSTQTITAGETMSLTVKANTSSVKTGVTTGTVTYSISVPGTAGPLQTGSAENEGLSWDYTPLNASGTAVSKTEGDSYPVAAHTLSY